MAETLEQLEQDLRDMRARSVDVRVAFRTNLLEAHNSRKTPPDIGTVLKAETAAAEAWARVEEFKIFGRTITPRPH
jgi:hypothetical protein